MFCENCGAKLADNSKFCQRCGAPVRQEDNVPGQENSGSYSAPPQAPAKKKIRKWPFILAAIILIAAACIIGGILIFQNKNEKNNFCLGYNSDCRPVLLIRKGQRNPGDSGAGNLPDTSCRRLVCD